MKNNFCKRDFVFENTVSCISKNPLKLCPEDGFRKKAETCSCHDVLTNLLSIYFIQ
jgi:hypothetical protein